MAKWQNGKPAIWQYGKHPMAKRPSLADSMKKLEIALPPQPAAAALHAVPPEAREGRGYYAATRMGRKKVTAALEPEAHMQLKILAAELGKTVEDILREAVSDLFRKYGKPPVA
jgi:hypothetical protein